MKSYDALIKLNDGSKKTLSGIMADDSINLQKLAHATAVANGLDVASVEMVYVTPPMKEPYFVVNLAADDFTMQDKGMWDGHSEYKGAYSGRTLAEFQAEFGDCVSLMEWDDAWPLYEAAKKAKYIGPVKQVTENRFNYLLEVLPPMKWERRTGHESFMLSEMLTDSITTIAAREGMNFYEFNDVRSLTHDEIMDKVREAVRDGKVEDHRGDTPSY